MSKPRLEKIGSDQLDSRKQVKPKTRVLNGENKNTRLKTLVRPSYCSVIIHRKAGSLFFAKKGSK